MKLRKFALKVEKAYELQGKYYVQGIASGTLEDRDEEKMSLDVIKNFMNAIKDGVMKGSPLPLTNGHAKGGPVGAELGHIMDAQVLDDGHNSLLIKAELDIDNPFSELLYKEVNKGKKYAFSIEGRNPEVKTTWSDKLGKFINEYVSILPKAISITSEPSYAPSFLEFVSKSYKYEQANVESNINLVTKEQMEDKTKVEAVAETTIAQPEMEANVEAVAGTTSSTPEAIVTSQVSEVAEPVVEAEVVAVEPDNGTVVNAEVVKNKKSGEIVEKGDGSEMVMTMQSSDLAEEIAQAIEGDKIDKALENVMESVEEAKEAIQEAEEDEEMAELEAKVDHLSEMVEMMCQTLNQLVDSDKLVHEGMNKSVRETEAVLKSFHGDLEILKDMPLAKKSKAMVEKSFDDRKEVIEANPYKRAVLNTIGE